MGEQWAFALVIMLGIDIIVTTIKDFDCYKAFNCTAIGNCCNKELGYQDKLDYFNSTVGRGFDSTTIDNRHFSHSITTTIIVEDKG